MDELSPETEAKDMELAATRTPHRFYAPVKRGSLGGEILEDDLCPMDLSP